MHKNNTGISLMHATLISAAALLKVLRALSKNVEPPARRSRTADLEITDL